MHLTRLGVNVNAAKLEKYNLSLLQVAQAVISANTDYPTGKIRNASQQMQIRLSGKYKSLTDLENLVITYNDGISPVQLKDIAEVRDSRKELQNLNRHNGLSTISLQIKKQGDANTVEVCERVKNELQQLEQIYNEQNLKFEIFSDQSVFTLEAANNVIKDLFLAILLVALVMLVFLHSLRNSFIVMVAIPASIFTTFVAMYLMDFSLNIMTLLGLSLSIGILVDDSIVVIENIHRHLLKGKNKVAASITGRSEIGYTALSITLVDIAVFLPMALAENILSAVIRQFALVIVVATLTSLFVSFTVTPLMASRIAKPENLKNNSFFKRFIDLFESFINRITSVLQNILRWSFSHKILVLSATTILFIGSVSLIPSGFIGTEFLDMGDRGEIIIQMELPKYATLEQTSSVARRVEKIVSAKYEVTDVTTQVGATSDMVDISSGSNKAEVTIKLVPKEKRKFNASVYAQLIILKENRFAKNSGLN